MPYSTAAQIRRESPFKNTQNVKTDYIEQVIDDVDGIINSYVSKIYVLPFISTPALVRSLSKDMAVCQLYRDQNPNVEIASGVSVEEWWTSLLAQLQAIVDQQINLVDSSGVELPKNGLTSPIFFPNALSSASNSTNPTSPKISMNQEF